MTTEQFSNAAITVLAGGITSLASSLVVGAATLFPTSPQFRILVENELMLVTAVTGTTFTVTRGIEGTSAAAHNNGVSVSHPVTAGALAQLKLDVFGGVQVTGPVTHAVLPTETYLTADSSLGAVTFNLEVAPAQWKRQEVKDETGFSATNNITVHAQGGFLIEQLVGADAANFVISVNKGSVTLVFTGSRWAIL